MVNRVWGGHIVLYLRIRKRSVLSKRRSNEKNYLIVYFSVSVQDLSARTG